MNLSERAAEKWARRSLTFDDYEVRETGTDSATIEGYASVFNHDYEVNDMFGAFTERIMPGAFTKTLRGKPDVVLLENHSGRPHASTAAGTLELSEDSRGLHQRASVNLQRSDTRDLYLALKDGSYREMSFAFRVLNDKWDETTWEDRSISEVSLDRGDVSVVTYGANPATMVAARNITDGLSVEDLAEALDALRDGDVTHADTVKRAVALMSDLLPPVEQGEPVEDLLRSWWAKRAA